MKTKVLLALLIICLFVFAEVLHRMAMNITPTNQEGINAGKLSQIINKWRESENRKPFIRADDLCKYADKRAIEIQYEFSHWEFQSSMDSPYLENYSRVGENLSYDLPDEESTLNAWLNSASHAANLRYEYDHDCIVCRGTKCAHIFGLTRTSP